MALDKTFDPPHAKAAIYAALEEGPRRSRLAWQTAAMIGNFTIMLPPPNVTGALHVGTPLIHTLMDILDAVGNGCRAYEHAWQARVWTTQASPRNLLWEKQLAAAQATRPRRSGVRKPLSRKSGNGSAVRRHALKKQAKVWATAWTGTAFCLYHVPGPEIAPESEERRQLPRPPCFKVSLRHVQQGP